MKKLTLIYELSMFTLAVISFFLIWTQPIKFYYMGKIVWIIFLIDVFTRFLLSKNKKEWVKKNYLDFVAIIPLNTVFQLARFARLFRIVKLFLVTKHYFMPFFQFIQTNGLTKVFSITFISILFSAIPITLFEPSIKSYNDGIWLAIVTVTTVGYGDMSPETLIGRIATVYLMFVGIGLVSMITGTIATYFIKSKSNSNIKESIKKDIDNIENLSNDEIESLIKIIRTYQN
ncbi:potassium channel family protein [Staphylococcus equorum]|uniref:potassium channel family protein n=1 Tax=Staphylococcus equorum TaxID=246432 RepID=UPI002DBBB372|nr:ion channel [Staphylococcus equorum]MEB7847989.1 potassium channel family protein [Staphylococcus equorum]